MTVEGAVRAQVMIGDSEPLPVVFVTLGTMHYPFERLMGWLDGWLRDRAGQARMVIQYGASTVPAAAEGFQMCGQEELLGLIRRSDIVVTQGGPGGIMDSRNCGIRPIAVPRLPELGEVVDDHQVRFCRYLAREGLIELAATQEELRAALDRAVADPQSSRVPIESGQVEAAIERTGELIEDLVRRRPPRRRRRR